MAEILFKRYFHHGLFVRSEHHRYVRLDDPFPTILLTLIAACRNKWPEVPAVLTQGDTSMEIIELMGKAGLFTTRSLFTQKN